MRVLYKYHHVLLTTFITNHSKDSCHLQVTTKTYIYTQYLQLSSKFDEDYYVTNVTTRL